MKKLPAPFTLPRAAAMKTAITAINPRSTGIWSASRPLPTAAVRSIFDEVLVRKDGLFVLPELEALNPENLK